MIIHTLQVPPEGLHVEGDEPPAGYGFEEAGFVPVSPVRYSLDVGLSDGGLFATGNLEVDLETECVGCLKRFKRTLAIPDFALQTDLGTSESIDLTPLMREDIFLALPAHPRCDADGHCACPGPGKYLKESVPDEAPNHVWDALENLNLKPKS